MDNVKAIEAIDQAIAALEASRAAHLRALMKETATPIEQAVSVAGLLDTMKANARQFLSGVMDNPLLKKLR